MSEVTGRSRRIASRHGARAPMTPPVIPAAVALPLTDERPEPACGCPARRWPRPSQSTRTEPRSTMIAALGFLAAALSITVVWPQVWLSCRHGRTLGLSPTGSWLAVGLNLCWLTFGLLVGDAPQIATHAVVGAGNTAVLAARSEEHTSELQSRQYLVCRLL